MNFQHAEKIKHLIETSTILNALERAEWKGLLELMNDKQLLELEEILSSNAPTPSAPKPIGQPQAQKSFQDRPLTHELEHKPEKPPVLKPNQPPHLGHILNMPKVPHGVAAKIPAAPLPKPTGRSGFFQRLRDVFTEKELPPGLPPHELSLEAPHTQKKPEPTLKEVQKPPVSQSPAPKLIPKMEHPVARQAVKTFAPEKPSKTSGIERLPNMINVSGYLRQNAKPQTPIRQTPETQTKHEPEIPSVPHLEEVAPVFKKPQTGLNKKTVDSLEELESLTRIHINSSDLPLLIKSIQNLARRTNTHEVVFHLEISPLYLAYVETGRKLLSSSGGFSELDLDKYLSQEEFEAVADLLREIQA